MSDFPAEPGCAVCASLSGPDRVSPLFENDLWHVRPSSSPAGVPGWMLLMTRRHAPSPAQFDDAEAASLGPTLRHLSRALLDVTGALRIYLAAMGESSPHFHCHLVPRYASMPKEAKAFAVFDLQRAAAAGEIPVDAAETARIAEAYRRSLLASPPPG
jgi:diadenosine tetraphosphate (Ap4A) HIT family hydrolase